MFNMLKNPDCEKIFPNKSIVCSQIINMSQIIIDVSICFYTSISIYIYISYGSNPPKNQNRSAQNVRPKKTSIHLVLGGVHLATDQRHQGRLAATVAATDPGDPLVRGFGIGILSMLSIVLLYNIYIYTYLRVFLYIYIYIYMSCTYLSNCLICLFLYLSIYVLCLIVYMKIAMSWVREKSRIS